MSMLVGNTRVGIVLENDTAGITGLTDIGPLYDSADQTYAEITHITDINIAEFEKMLETIQVVGDNFDHDIIIRTKGSGEISFKLDANESTADFENLLYAASTWPCGVTGAAGAAEYDPSDDTATTALTDLRGYAVIVETLVTTGRYFQLVFHNCRIAFLPSISPQSAASGTLRWEDARYIGMDADAATHFGNHSDSTPTPA